MEPAATRPGSRSRTLRSGMLGEVQRGGDHQGEGEAHQGGTPRGPVDGSERRSSMAVVMAIAVTAIPVMTRDRGVRCVCCL